MELGSIVRMAYISRACEGHGIRSDRLGLGHIGKEPGRSGRAGIEAGGGDGLEVIKERDAGLVDRRAGPERNAGCEPTSNLDWLQKWCTEPALAKWPTWAGPGRTRWNRPGIEATGWDSQTSIGFTDIDRFYTGGEATD